MPTTRYGHRRYRKIADDLRTQIRQGSLPSGRPLPTEAALAVEFKASRGTIRQALSLLREEGVVATQQGRGTYVVGPSSPLDLLRTGASNESGRVREYQVPAPEDLAKIFGVPSGTPLWVREVIERSPECTSSVVRVYSVRG
ncbi:GntR family transcriptional regulator [Micromonospora arida]